ncbi:MAG TPA: flagellar hook-associated protein FlgK [Acidobacteriota bacterium]|nr:flagellar hook-associated protein FlgK [Acidobacteriota bacterium]
MTSILSGFDTVQQALAAQQFALSIAQRNVANVNDPNYTRQDVVFNPTGDGYDYGGAGVSISASRDRYLDYSISREMQSLGYNSVSSDALQQVDAIFGGSSSGSLQEALSNFFNSFSALSGAPEDLSLRQQVLSSANALAAEFHRVYSAIQQVQTSTDNSVKYTVDDINSITSQIADLNVKIQVAQQSHSETESTLRDNRQQLLENLSSLVDVSYFETESGAVTVTTRQGGLLVAGNENQTLTLTHSAAGDFQRVQLNGTDITDTLESGKLGGLIHLRDNVLAGYLNTLDDMAVTITDRVNEVHAQGTDLNGAAGGDLFTPFAQVIPGSNTGAARAMSVAITDPAQIAAAAAGGGAGDNTNAKLLAGISEEKLFSGSTQSASEYYGQLLYTIGTDEKSAEDGTQTQNDLVEQLKNQRASSSGVSLDEEAVNIIKYQKAYQASSRLANVLDTLSGDILNMLGT